MQSDEVPADDTQNDAVENIIVQNKDYQSIPGDFELDTVDDENINDEDLGFVLEQYGNLNLSRKCVDKFIESTAQYLAKKISIL